MTIKSWQLKGEPAYLLASVYVNGQKIDVPADQWNWSVLGPMGDPIGNPGENCVNATALTNGIVFATSKFIRTA